MLAPSVAVPVLLSAILFGFAHPAAAVVLGFDSLPDSVDSFNLPFLTATAALTGATSDTSIRIRSLSDFVFDGFVYGEVSPTNIAYNAFADPAELATADSSKFNFIGADFTAAWNDGLNIEVKGYRNNVVVYDQTVVANTTTPDFFAFNYQKVDRLNFASFGGIHHSAFGGAGTHFAMDDFTFTPVPEPSTCVLAVIGAVILGSMGRQGRRTPPRNLNS